MSRFRLQNDEPHLIKLYILKADIATASRNVLIGTSVIEIAQ